MTTFRMHLRSGELDSLLLDSLPEERNESVRLLQELEESTRQGDRFRHSSR